MCDKNLKIGQRCEILGKNAFGVIAYIGTTNFSSGKWVGVILDEPKGKNNGTIKGQIYFTCKNNHGIFIRATQLKCINNNNDIGNSQIISEIQPLKIEQTNRSPRFSNTKLSLSASTSRHNLLIDSSRSQLSSPTTTIVTNSTTGINSNHKLPIVSPTELYKNSKRSSFIETGFMEILRPQFIPGQTMRSPSFLLATEQKKTIEELKGQVEDLTNQLESLKKLNYDEKEKSREYEKIKIQYEYLLEFKTKIIESNGLLQKELQRIRQENKDLIEAKIRHEEEMIELSDNLELITLDKEMAEEKSETLQIELDEAKERNEELSIDIEILRNEMNTKGDELTNLNDYNNKFSTNNVSINFELKQLKQQNQRLKETLINLRDVSAKDKTESLKIAKELETKKSEILELQRTKEKLSLKIDELECQILELFEQVDAALGAEEMVENLTEKNLDLEDKTKFLEEEVNELEAMREIHEQILESNTEYEHELQEEIEMLNALNKELMREKDAALETIYDRDITAIKFRELVQSLNEHIHELNKQQRYIEKEQNLNNEMSSKTMSFNQIFAESKAQARVIDIQLREFRLIELQQHIDILLKFMTDDFHKHDGDYNAINIYLLIPRILFKCTIIIDQVKDRFSSIDENFDKDAILHEYSVHQYSFKCRYLHYIFNLQMIMHQIIFVMNDCSAQDLLRFATTLPEAMGQERILDNIIELLKSNRLDENSSTENLEKSIIFFNAIKTILINDDTQINETLFLKDCLLTIETASDAILTDAGIIQRLIRVGEESTDSYKLLQNIIDNAISLKNNLKPIKQKLTKIKQIEINGFDKTKIESLNNEIVSLTKVISALSNGSKQSINRITNLQENNSNEFSINHTELWTILVEISKDIHDDEKARNVGPLANFQEIFIRCNLDLLDIGKFFKDYEFDSSNNNNKINLNKMSPIVERAMIVKNELEETKILGGILEEREIELKQYKIAFKMKLNEISEMQVRKELAEKKIASIQSAHDIEMERCKEYILDAYRVQEIFEQQFSNMEKQLELMKTNKFQVDTINASLTVENEIIDSTEEVKFLKSALIIERNENLQLKSNEMINTLKSLKPIYVPQPIDDNLQKLYTELSKLKRELILSHIKLKSYDDNGIPIKDNNQLNVMKKMKILKQTILEEYFKRHPHRSNHTDFSIFPTKEFHQQFQI